MKIISLGLPARGRYDAGATERGAGAEAVQQGPHSTRRDRQEPRRPVESGNLEHHVRQIWMHAELGRQQGMTPAIPMER